MKTAKDLIIKAQVYSWDDFKSDFQKMIDLYNRMDSSDPVKEVDVRAEFAKYDYAVSNDTMYDIDVASAHYVRFMEYRNRITEVYNQVRKRTKMLEAIIKKVHGILPAVVTSGTISDKKAKSEIILLDFDMMHTQSEGLMSFIKDHKDDVEFCTTQLARILREKEANKWLSSSYANRGVAHTEMDETIKAKNR